MRPIDALGLGPRYEETQTANGWTVKVIPPAWAHAGSGASVDLTEDQYRRYRQWKDIGRLIQDALPELTPSQREILMTGLDDEAFHKYTGDEEEDFAEDCAAREAAEYDCEDNTCPFCRGTGGLYAAEGSVVFIDQPCEECGGTGRLRRSE